MSIEVSPEYGGAGANFFSAVLVIEELAKVDPSVSIFCDVQNTLIMEMFHKYASKELQEKYLPKLSKNLVKSLATLVGDPFKVILFNRLVATVCQSRLVGRMHLH